jgi:hypothetical protein
LGHSKADLLYWSIRILVAGLVAAQIFFMAFPELIEPVKPGTDPAWIYGINEAKVLGLSFGSDVMYTYGPLGYLLEPLDLGSNLIRALGFGIAFAASLALIVACSVRRWAGAWNGLICALCLSPALRIRLDSDKRYALLQLIAMTVALERSPARVLTGAIAMFAAVAMLIRSSFGILAVATFTVLLLVQWFRSVLTWRWLLVYGGLYWVTLIVGFAMSGNRLVDLGAYLVYSFQLANAYSEAMAFAGPLIEVALALVCFGYFLGVAMLMGDRSARLSALVMAPAFVFGFKHAFVRQDPLHFPEFFIVLFGAFGCLALVARSWRERVAIVLGLAVGLTSYASVMSDRHQPFELASWFDARGGGGTATGLPRSV